MKNINYPQSIKIEFEYETRGRIAYPPTAIITIYEGGLKRLEGIANLDDVIKLINNYKPFVGQEKYKIKNDTENKKEM